MLPFVLRFADFSSMFSNTRNVGDVEIYRISLRRSRYSNHEIRMKLQKKKIGASGGKWDKGRFDVADVGSTIDRNLDVSRSRK